MVNQTTIQISNNLLEALRERKIYDKESYEELIWDLLESNMEFSKEALKDLKKSEGDIKAERVMSHREVKKRLRL